MNQEWQQYDEHSEYAGKSNVDSILDSGNFCNDDGSGDTHSHNHSRVQEQFAELENLKINSKLTKQQSGSESNDQASESVHEMKSE
jgi:hypothetical protein